jgi:hypothetical protein
MGIWTTEECGADAAGAQSCGGHPPSASGPDLPYGSWHRVCRQCVRERLAELNITQSMNRPGKVTDNAFMESFFHSMKSETIHGCTFSEDDQMLSVLRSYIPFYNRSRIHYIPELRVACNV